MRTFAGGKEKCRPSNGAAFGGTDFLRLLDFLNGKTEEAFWLIGGGNGVFYGDENGAIGEVGFGYIGGADPGLGVDAFGNGHP